MKERLQKSLIFCLGLLAISAHATTYYVDINSTNATPPYTNWSTASTDIQSAIDQSSPGDLVLVNDGVYQMGGRVYNGAVTNLVVIAKAVTVESIDGPNATVIQGNPVIGPNAVRCVYLGTNAVLSGFTINGGATGDYNTGDANGAGVLAEDISALVTNCVLTGNQAYYQGGGAYGCTLVNCQLSGNTAYAGAGVAESVLTNCTVTSNTSIYQGGGTVYSALTECSVAGNSSYEAGGAEFSTLNNCTLLYNTGYLGGGAAWSTLNNCLVATNSATYGGGVEAGTLNNCTVVFNTGGGAAGATANNSIIYYNQDDNYYDYDGFTSFNYCCTTPMPGGGSGNITNAPSFASLDGGNYRLQIFSPCIDAGNNSLVVGDTDLDGNPRIAGSAVDMGAYEFHGGTHYVDVNSANPVPPYLSWSTAATDIQDAVDASGDGDLILVNDGVYNTGGRLVYGALTNRVVINKTVTVQSVNGPLATIIEGYQAPGTTNDDTDIRCVYLTNSATLSGFTITQGGTRGNNGSGPIEEYGGGIFSESGSCIITNCVISGNTANGGAGGAYSGSFFNCSFVNNFAWGSGGGVSQALLDGCTISGNSTTGEGGGADSCTATNCSFIGNLAANPNSFSGGGGGGANGSTLLKCFFTGNTAIGGGGARSSTIVQCVFSNNFAAGKNPGGAGIENSIAVNCVIENNHSYGVGGGVDYSALTNCIIIGNVADQDGGGFWGGGFGAYFTLNNCLVISNSAAGFGGGANDGDLFNSTVVGNWAGEGGGVFTCSVYNSIVYDNDAGYQPNHASYTYFDHSCTTPMPIPNEDGPGNFTADPQLADVYHLSAGSPCRHAGNPAYAVGADFDGLPWANPPSVGCDEYIPGAVTGLLTVAIQPDYTNVATGFTVNFAIQTTGHAGNSVWDFGDGTTATNQPFAFHAWTAPGTYNVTFTVYNESNPGGVSSSVAIQVVAPPVHYVSLDSVNPVAPYTSWGTAANNIQDAVDASEIPGAMILVSNGVYNTGGQIVSYALSNRVAVTKPVTLQSVNGAAVTVIQGNPVIGDSAVRCLWMTNGSALRGFTITQGASHESVAFEPAEISAGGVWCQSKNVSVSDCMIVSNSAYWDGGGITGGTISNCTFIGNSGGDAGGAAAGGVYTQCQFLNNSCIEAGGVWDGIANNCYFIGNTATPPYGDYGGATYEGVLNNCALSGNVGDATAHSLLNNCTLVANVRGGAESSTLNNCIAFYNVAANGSVYNYSSDSVLNYCCATPLATNGVGNIATDPQLADAAHLSANSPCRGAGNPAYVSGVDIDGQPWLNPPSIGCDEYYAGAVGSLAVTIQTAFTNFAVGYANGFQGLINGHASANQWDFGDGTVVSNLLAVTHSWAATGDYNVILTAYNDDNPGGVSATVTVQVVQGDYYVAQNNPNPVAPYTSWATAATNIEDAVNAAVVGAKIFVSDGVYQYGGDLGGGSSNRVSATFPLLIQSVNGPAKTVIDGMATMRGVYLTNGAALFGFTVTNGNGGGVAGESTLSVVSNCVIVANAGGGVSVCSVYNSILSGNISGGNGGGASRCLLDQCFIANNVVIGQYGEGGGVFQGTLNECVVSNNATTGSVSGGAGVEESTLNNCLVVSNFSSGWCGGADLSTLNNCTVVGNSAVGQSWSWGGGVGNGTANNCIIYYNSAPNAPNIGYSTTANYTCAPDSVSGPGNFTNAPAFVNFAGGDYHLQFNSPCINSGNNADVTTATDLEGNPRIVGGTVDMGAYEYQTLTSVISYAYLQQYGLPTDGSVDYSDLDGTGFNVYQDWIAGLNPTNPASVLAMLTPVTINTATGVTVSWQSVAGVPYTLQRSTNLTAQPSFSTIQGNITGQAGTTSYQDTSATNTMPYFYRVGVAAP